MDDLQLGSLKGYVAARYSHLPESTQKEILDAYVASSKRKKGTLLKERGCAVYTDVSSSNYKDFWRRSPYLSNFYMVFTLFRMRAISYAEFCRIRDAWSSGGV